MGARRVPVHLLLAAIVNNRFKRAIVEQGSGEGPVPVNTLYTEPQALFAEPLAAQSSSGVNLMTTGVNHDTLLTGRLARHLSKEPLVLHVPEFSGRYSVQFTDPFDTDFAYVGTRTTGTLGWASILLLGRVGRTGAERHDAGILSEQFGSRYWAYSRV